MMMRACFVFVTVVVLAAPFASANPPVTSMGYLVGWGECGPLELCSDPIVEAWVGNTSVGMAKAEPRSSGAVYRLALQRDVQSGIVTFTVDGAPTREYLVLVPGGTFVANLTPQEAGAPPPRVVEVSTKLPDPQPNEVVRVMTPSGEVVASTQAGPEGLVEVGVPAWPGRVHLVRANLEVVNVTLEGSVARVTWPQPAGGEGEQVLDSKAKDEVPLPAWIAMMVVGAAALLYRRGR